MTEFNPSSTPGGRSRSNSESSDANSDRTIIRPKESHANASSQEPAATAYGGNHEGQSHQQSGLGYNLEYHPPSESAVDTSDDTSAARTPAALTATSTAKTNAITNTNFDLAAPETDHSGLDNSSAQSTLGFPFDNVSTWHYINELLERIETYKQKKVDRSTATLVTLHNYGSDLNGLAQTCGGMGALFSKTRRANHAACEQLYTKLTDESCRGEMLEWI